MPRHYRRMRRTRGLRPVTKTYKKVLTFAPASHPAVTKIDFPLVLGVDSISPGQGGVTDATVPTGSIIDYIEINYSFINITGGADFMSICIQQTLVGQTTLDPRVVGGNMQRNQVFHQEIFSMGNDQNGNRVYRFKIPKRFQRVREGMAWTFTALNSGTFSDNCQVIYKIKS